MRKSIVLIVALLSIIILSSCENTSSNDDGVSDDSLNKTEEKFTLKFLDYDETVLKEVDFVEGDSLSRNIFPPDPSRDGHTFSGWDIELPNIMPNRDFIINATYSIISYSLMFLDYDGTILQTENYDYGADLSKVTEPNDPTREGYTFNGWDIAVPATMGTNNITITASYSINKYTLEYVDYDGTILQIADYVFGADLSKVTAPTDPTREGYTFNGWDIAVPTTMGTNNITITASYSINKYTLEYVDYDGTVLQTGNYDFETDLSNISAPDVPDREGYTFSGWDTVMPLKMDANNISITALYTINQYEASYYIYDDTDLSTNVLLYANEEIQQVQLGYSFSVLLTSRGRILTWGRNRNGELGDGTTTDNYLPTDITNHFDLDENETFIEIVVGGSISMAITSTNRIFMWGHYYMFDINDSSEPIEITNLLNLDEDETISFMSINAFITSKNRVFVWGPYSSGLSDGTTGNNSVPIEITDRFNLIDDETVIDISVGISSYALTSMGRLFTWGSNNYGQLGDGTNDDKLEPIEITQFFNLEQNETIVSVASGRDHKLAVTSMDKVFAWGANYYGQLGNDTKTSANLPVNISSYFDFNSSDSVMKIVSGQYKSYLITSSGQIYNWGYLGNTTVNISKVPVNMTDSFNLINEQIIDISAGEYHAIVITSENNLFSWGRNASGELGTGSRTTNSLYPYVMTPQQIHFVEPSSVEIISYTYMEELEYYPLFTDYTLDGWYTDVDFSTLFIAKQMPSNEIILFAIKDPK